MDRNHWPQFFLSIAIHFSNCAEVFTTLSCQTASRSSFVTLWVFMRKTVEVPRDSQFGILTERRQCHMQTIVYNVYFCAPCIWTAKVVKINLWSAAQEALASSVTGWMVHWHSGSLWDLVFPEWNLYHPAAYGLGWEVAGAPRKGSGCPAWTEGGRRWDGAVSWRSCWGLSRVLLPRKFSFPLEVTAVHSSRRNWDEVAERRREKSLRVKRGQTHYSLSA